MGCFVAASLLWGYRVASTKESWAGCVGFLSLPSGVLPWFLRARLRLPYGLILLGGDVPGFYTSRGHALFQRLTYPVNRRIWNQASFVLANSEGLRDLAQQAVPGLEIGILPTGVDTDRFRTVSRGFRPPLRLLFIGRLVRQKGADVLLDALSRLHGQPGGPDWSLTIVGDGPERDRLERMAVAGRIADQVRFLGWVPPSSLSDLYLGHDVLVQPSRNEGMSCVIAEGMACGLPVLGTNCRGTQEQVVSGEGGLLVPVEDAGALAVAIRKACSSPDLLAQWSQGARRRAEEFSWSRLAERFEGLVESVFPSMRDRGGES